METKRVVFQIIPSLVPAGAERVVVHLLQYHDRSKYQPVCVCLGNPTGSHYELLVSQLGIPIHFLGKGARATVGLMKRLDALFREYRPTVVHMHLRGLTYAYPLLLKYRTPVRVYTVHNLAGYDRGTNFQRLVSTLAFRYQLGRVIPVAIAERVRQSVQEVYRYPNPPLIPNGISVEDFILSDEARKKWRLQEGIAKHTVVITHVGRFTRQKNHALLIQAVAQIHSAHPWLLLLVGEGELRPAVEEMVKAHGLADRVRFMGVRGDIPQILNASDIFVLSSRYEGNPMSVMEAMAAGLPVVSTAVGGVPELVEEGQTGLLVPSEDENALSSALQRLIDDTDLRRTMGARAREVALTRFDARVMTRAYETLYETLLNK
jgi:glycosyltransferase involved in cell wall biosynthesis